MKMVIVCMVVLMFSNTVCADLVTSNYTTGMANVLRLEINGKADNNDVVHISGGKEVITSDKEFSGVVTLTNEIPMDDDTNRAATTKWTRDRIDDSIGFVPVAGSETPAQMWVE